MTSRLPINSLHFAKLKRERLNKARLAKSLAPLLTLAKNRKYKPIFLVLKIMH
jgi:hypothetical protein